MKRSRGVGVALVGGGSLHEMLSDLLELLESKGAREAFTNLRSKRRPDMRHGRGPATCDEHQQRAEGGSIEWVL